MNLLNTEQISQVFEIFSKQNPNPVTELNSTNAYTLLVAVILSAQTTDKSVNKVTAELFKVVSTPQEMLEVGEERLQQYIHSIGLYRTKATHIISMSRVLINQFNSKVPNTLEQLETLPGVGRKTANVILNVVFGQKTMPVDTHILRISPRIGLSLNTTPETVEQDLILRIPQKYMEHAHHWLVLHGRYVCKARKPECNTCCINKLCLKNF